MNPYQNTPSGEEKNPTNQQKKIQKPKSKLNKIGSSKTKQQIFTLDPDCVCIFRLQQQVGKKKSKEQTKQNQKP